MGQFNQFPWYPSFPIMNLPAQSDNQRRFRPRLLPTMATLLGIALFVTAGQWQQRRMDQKLALRSAFDVASAAVAVALPDSGVDWAAWRYRPVAAVGTFDASRQILIDNKIDEGHVGYHVVTPLLLADGRAVLVNRGWISAGESRRQLPLAVPPAGVVSVHGRVNIPTTNYLELNHDAPAGPVWQNLDPARFAAATGLMVLPVVLEQTTPVDAADQLVRNWTAPDFGIDRHRIYMVQWYLFAATAAGLWLYFNLLRPRKEEAP